MTMELPTFAEQAARTDCPRQVAKLRRRAQTRARLFAAHLSDWPLLVHFWEYDAHCVDNRLRAVIGD